MEEFAKLQKSSDLLFWQKNEVSIITKYGNLQANNFSLKNIYEEPVSLVSLANKVIVLDFWANWCGPCKESFPVMQELINKYKNDSDIVFLFIDVWEKDSPQINLQKTKQFMTQNNYAFNVLFDVNNKVVTEYKIKGIPTKFIINKKGKITYIEDNPVMLSKEQTIKNISFFIEAAKK
jgi:thiol-disulfide isomerase/thioredoxin